MKTFFSFFLVGLMILSSNLFAAKAQTLIHPTSDESKAWGTAEFQDTEAGLKIKVQIENASPGKHGLHIHQNGSCDDQGKAAGDHFNPENAHHGFLPANGIHKSHGGDLGNIEITEDGRGVLELLLSDLSVDGDYGVIGKSVVMHEHEDLFTQPAGDAGARVACGVIKVSE